MGTFNRSPIRTLSIALAMLAGGARTVAEKAIGYNAALEFSRRYGSNPRSLNGGQRSGVAAAKRAKAKRRNIGKRNRSAHCGRRHG